MYGRPLLGPFGYEDRVYSGLTATQDVANSGGPQRHAAAPGGILPAPRSGLRAEVLAPRYQLAVLEADNISRGGVEP